MSSYNLIDEPWIPVRDVSGNLKEAGIKEVLLSAKEFVAIEDPSPLVTASLYRFLLAVLYRALEGPCDDDEAKKLFREGFPKQKIAAYLEKWRPRFFLFDEKYPFGQVSGYEPMVKNGKQNWRSWTALVAEHNADNAKVLFDHVDASASGEIPFKKAVRWLLACNTFVLGGGNSDFKYTKDAPSSSSAMAIPIGENLQDTLLYCLVPQNYELTATDIPLWERDAESVEFLKDGVDRSEMGHADLYTWRSRSIRFEEKNIDGITRLAFASGIGYVDSALIDPMVGYKIVDVKDKETGGKVKKKLPVRFEDRGIWRDFDSLLPDESHLAPLVIENAVLLARNTKNKFPQTVLVLGQANNKAKIKFWRMEEYVLPGALAGDNYIRADIKSCLELAKATNKLLYASCCEYATNVLSKGGRIPEKKNVSDFVEQMAVLSSYWSTLEKKFHEMLSEYTLDKNPDDIQRNWFISVRDALSSAWQLQRNSITGSDAWAIRAFFKADDIVKGKIAELNKNIQLLKGVA